MKINGLRQYLVTWEIDEWAESAKEAACKALITMRNKNSIATVFKVHDVKTPYANVQTFDITENVEKESLVDEL